MPSKQGLCWCFGGSRPPEISYGVELKPKPMEADIPMPTDENELNAKFEELVAELDLDKPHRDALCSLPSEKKWQIYCSKKKEQDDPSSTVWPDYYIERIKAMPSEFLGFSDEELETRSNLVEDLKTALRTQPMSFVVRFIDEGGVQCLLDYLSRMDYKSSESAIHTSVIGSIKALMNNSQGRAHVLAHPDSINIIAQSLSVENIKTKIAVLEILGACCIVPGGHKKTLDAMYHYQKYAGERTRFQSLIYDLDRSTGKYRDEVNLKTAVMSFINAALKYGPGMEHLEFRLHLRYEFLMLGIQPVIDKLRSHGNTTLDRHLDFFEMVRNEDERELAKRFDGTHVDTKSASSMFDLLKKKIALSVVYQNLQSILQHLLMLPYNNGNNLVGIWKLIDKMVQQVVLQQKIGGKDTDTAPLEINVKQLVLKLSNETDIKEYQQKLREVEKSKDDLSSKLTKRERECEAKTEEREELMSTISKMKSKLEKESAAHAEAKQQAAELIAKMEQFHMQLEAERGEREKLQHLVQTGSLPDDAKVGLSTPSMLNNPLSSITPVIPPPAPGPPPPPPPPGPPAPPGAPPPPGPPGMKPPGASTKKKNIPQPSHPLKSFNWSKLAEGKIKDTVWRDLDDCQIYNILDLQELEKTFSAYQRQQINDEDKQTFDKSVNKQKVKEFSVIDGRRAQNCIILLSKLKLTNEEISKAIMTMDEQEDLPKDMLEQMLKFIPTAEESQLLTENSHELENMARADRFLYEMSKIPHYENRLNSLYFKKKFQERLSDVKSRIEVVYDSSKQISRSRKLKKLLEIVLAFGNYMNKGQRGNAYGFRLSSLNKITDTKSSLNTNINLMNYLVEVVEKQFPDIMKIEEDLKSVKTASKVSFTELDKDIGALRSGLKLIDKELDYYRDRLPEAGDRFGAVMNNFHALASYNFSEVEEVYMEMKQKYQTVVKSFDEEDKVQPDEFFGIFESFLVAFSEAKADNEKIKKQKEEEKKRAELEEKLKKEKFLKKNTLEKQGNITNGTNTKGEFDDLISALRTGDVFGDDIAKMKRNRRRGQSPGLSRERTGARVN